MPPERGAGTLSTSRHVAVDSLPERLMTTTFADPVSSTVDRPAAIASQPGRIDLYVSIHKALRSFMTDTLTRIGRVDVADRADRHAALDQLDELLALCLDHLRHENE